MIAAFLLGLLPDGEALYTDSFKPLEEQKLDAIKWLHDYDNLISVHAIVGAEITDITAAYCRMWINRADLSDIRDESDFPSLIRETVPEHVSEVIAAWEDEERHRGQLRSDYHASVL